MRHHHWISAITTIVAVVCLCLTSAAAMPMPFTKNMGQWDARVLFRTVSGGATIWLCRDGITYQFTHRMRPEGSDEFTFRDRLSNRGVQTAIVHAKFVSPSATLEAIGEGELDYKCNYFFGNDPTRWRTDVPNYASVTYREVYPGVDLRVSGGADDFQTQWLAKPGVELESVSFEYSGNVEVIKTQSGEVIASTPWGQEMIETTRKSPCPGGSPSPGEQLSGISGTQSLSLEYLTTFNDEALGWGADIAVDSSGHAYIIGTSGSGFPLVNPIDSIAGWHNEAFISKISPDGQSMVFSTFLGGADIEEGEAIAVDREGRAVVAGFTVSADFPMVNAYDTTTRIGLDFFVARLSSEGNALEFSTRLGGSWLEDWCDIAVDWESCVYLVGTSSSLDFPIQSAFDSTLNGCDDVVLTKFSPSGQELEFSTFLGGTGYDYGKGIAVDSPDVVWVTGYTTSPDFPVVAALDSVRNGETDAFVAKLLVPQGILVFSTLLGGIDRDQANAIAVDESGAASVAGWTDSPDFHAIRAYQGQHGGSTDAFITKVAPNADSLLYSTFLGGSSIEAALGIAVDCAGSAYVVGYTASNNFPELYSLFPQPPTWGGFTLKLSPLGDDLIFSTYHGFSPLDEAYSVVVEPNGEAYVVGTACVGACGPLCEGGSDVVYTLNLFANPLEACGICDCQRSADLDRSGTIDAVDLAIVIDVVFFGATDVQDYTCPNTRSDFNANGLTDAVDLAFLIDHVFFGGPGPVDPCL